MIIIRTKYQHRIHIENQGTESQLGFHFKFKQTQIYNIHCILEKIVKIEVGKNKHLIRSLI